MSKRTKLSIWAPFLVASLLTIAVYETLYAKKHYWEFLSFLGVVSSALAVRILRRTGLKVWPLFAVALGLIAGQWWFIGFAVTQLVWTFNGFAP